MQKQFQELMAQGRALMEARERERARETARHAREKAPSIPISGQALQHAMQMGAEQVKGPSERNIEHELASAGGFAEQLSAMLGGATFSGLQKCCDWCSTTMDYKTTQTWICEGEGCSAHYDICQQCIEDGFFGLCGMTKACIAKGKARTSEEKEEARQYAKKKHDEFNAPKTEEKPIEEPKPAMRKEKETQEEVDGHIEKVETLVNMGYKQEQAQFALEITNENIQEAIDWLLRNVQEQEEKKPEQSKKPSTEVDKKSKAVAEIIALGYSEEQANFAFEVNDSDDVNEAVNWLMENATAKIEENTSEKNNDVPVEVDF